MLLQGLEITSETSTGGIVVQGVLNPQNYPIDPGSVTWSGLSGVSQGGQPSFAQIAPGGGTEWSSGAGSTATAAISADIDTGAFTPMQYGTGENSSPIDLDADVYNGAGPVYSGVEIYESSGGGSYTVAGETFLVTSIELEGDTVDINFRSSFGRFRRRQGWTTSPPSIFFRQPSYVGLTNKLIFAKAAWEASEAAEGTPVAASDTNWPAGTAVTSVQLKTLGSTEFYEVTFNQSSTTALNVADTVTFDFAEPPFAQPGEQVFSFIANPGERSTLDLSQLKELTNTPLGGRGTYPNGPDVLAINVYKISGADVAANIILKWGEAQA